MNSDLFPLLGEFRFFAPSLKGEGWGGGNWRGLSKGRKNGVRPLLYRPSKLRRSCRLVSPPAGMVTRRGEVSGRP